MEENTYIICLIYSNKIHINDPTVKVVTVINPIIWWFEIIEYYKNKAIKTENLVGNIFVTTYLLPI